MEQGVLPRPAVDAADTAAAANVAGDALVAEVKAADFAAMLSLGRSQILSWVVA